MMSFDDIRTKTKVYDDKQKSEKNDEQKRSESGYALSYERAQKAMPMTLADIRAKMIALIPSGEFWLRIDLGERDETWTAIGKEYGPSDQALIDTLEQMKMKFKVEPESGYDPCDHPIVRYVLSICVPGREAAAAEREMPNIRWD